MDVASEMIGADVLVDATNAALQYTEEALHRVDRHINPYALRRQLR
jgi:hypothetical protein